MHFLSYLLNPLEVAFLCMKFFISWLYTFMTTPGTRKIAEWGGDDVKIEVEKALVQRYKDDLSLLQKRTRELFHPGPLPFRAQVVVVIAQSCAACVLMLRGDRCLAFLAWLLVYVWVPFALPAALATVASVVMSEGPAYVAMLVLSNLLRVVPSRVWTATSFIVGPQTLAFCFGFHVACSIVVQCLSQYQPKLSTLLWSAVWSLPCQLYFLFIGGLYFNTEVNLLVLVSSVPLARKAGGWLGSDCLFTPALFFQHVVAHVPAVYKQSHKWHHEIADTTAFDSCGLGGVGFPELALRVVWDGIMFLAGCPFFYVSYQFLYNVLSGKAVHGHSDASPYHWEHHMYYSVNLDDHACSLIDILFGSFHHKLPHRHQLGCVVDKHETDLHHVVTVKVDAGVNTEDGLGAKPLWYRRLCLPGV